jgi:ribosomal protein S18 acetylase RimI-like enzyme
MTELERCVDFLRSFALTIAGRTEEGRFGLVLFNDDLPQVWSLNQMLAERDLDGATAPDLIAEADRLLGAAGLRHRKIELWDEQAGLRLEAGFHAAGWHVERDLVMTYERPPDREIDTTSVDEFNSDELGPTFAEAIRTEPFGKDEQVVRQLVEYRHVLARKGGARFFAARANGRFASLCELYSGDGIGQIESVLTLPAYRNRGLARQVVWKALEESQANGDDITFLLADDADWPKHLYVKLGFDPVGAIYDFALRR